MVEVQQRRRTPSPSPPKPAAPRRPAQQTQTQGSSSQLTGRAQAVGVGGTGATAAGDWSDFSFGDFAATHPEVVQAGVYIFAIALALYVFVSGHGCHTRTIPTIQVASCAARLSFFFPPARVHIGT